MRFFEEMKGIYLDETNEYVDNVLHYIAPGKTVLAWSEKKSPRI